MKGGRESIRLGAARGERPVWGEKDRREVIRCENGPIGGQAGRVL